MGTPAYMSPEQCEGRGQVDHRTDVYALGILLYECLTGRVPFLGEGYGEVLVQHLTQPPQRPSSARGVIPPHVEVVCLKALEKKPDARFPNMAEFMKALADPVGYVEQSGGIDGFVGRNLGAASPQVEAPFSPLAGAPASYPIAPLTPQPMPGYPTPAGHGMAAYVPTPPPGPIPGAGPMPMPPPGHATPSPGTLQPASPTPMAAVSYAPFQTGQGGSKLKWVALVGGLAVIAVVAVFVVLGSRGSQKPDPEVIGEPTAPGATGAAGAAPPSTRPAQTIAAENKPPEQMAAATAPRQVVFRVHSRPQGAQVFVGDADKPTGVTPADVTLSRGDAPVTLRLVKDGFEPETNEYIPDTNRDIDIKLAAQAKPGDKPADDDRRDRRRERDRRSGSRDRGSDEIEMIGDDKAKPRPRKTKPGEDEGFDLIR
jgi:serine/threonine-protein kinase